MKFQNFVLIKHNEMLGKSLPTHPIHKKQIVTYWQPSISFYSLQITIHNAAKNNFLAVIIQVHVWVCVYLYGYLCAVTNLCFHFFWERWNDYWQTWKRRIQGEKHGGKHGELVLKVKIIHHLRAKQNNQCFYIFYLISSLV